MVLLTEKQIAETLMTVPEFLQNVFPIERGLTDPAKEKVASFDRYKITEDGLSKRWIPGSDEEAYYFSNSDEHDEMGRLTEDAEPSKAMYEKTTSKNGTHS